MKKRFFLTTIVIASFLISSYFSIVLADGMIIPPVDYRVYETGQKAVIFHDGKKETLILSVTFKADAKDFAWIIPVPSKPEVDKGQDSLFTSLENLTRLKKQPMPLYEKAIPGMGGGAVEAPVTVIETKKVDIYDIQVLTATDSKALVKWFSDNNYPYPSHASYILDSYINNHWFFVAAKVSTEALGSMVADQLKEGHATPLKISFNTDKIVFPLRISGVLPLESDNDRWKLHEGETSNKPELLATQSAIGKDQGGLTLEENRAIILPPRPVPTTKQVSITLYIFASHKKEIPGFTIQYANWVDQKKIEKLAQTDMGDPWIKTSKKMYLTKLYRNMPTSQMTEDLFPQNAQDNKSVGQESPFANLPKMAILLVPILFELLIIAVILVKRTSSK